MNIKLIARYIGIALLFNALFMFISFRLFLLTPAAERPDYCYGGLLPPYLRKRSG